MTQLGEAVAIGLVDDDEVKCPFEHGPPPAKNGENKLVGKGGTLAQKMESGASSNLREGKKQKEVPNPKKVQSHPFHNGRTCVAIEVVQPDPPATKKQKTPGGASVAKPETEEYAYKVSCAAHHCIPAQESLKESPLLAYMVKKSDSEQLKDETFDDGLVWADVGYDVNGSENGVWLPGNYAVSGSRNGSLWQSGDGDDDADDDEDEDVNNAASGYEAEPPQVADPAASDKAAYQRLLEFSEPIDDDDASNILAGKGAPFTARPDSRKWRYVAQAMKLCPGQFHDRHEDYSAFVGKVLTKIYQNYQRLEKRKVFEAECPDCAKRAKDIEKAGTPTPLSLVPRLNGVSARMRQMLSGNAWPENVYTSKWVRSYLAELKKAKVTPVKLVF